MLVNRRRYARNTERALWANVASFTGWCAQTRRHALPVTPETVTGFIDAMAVSKGLDQQQLARELVRGGKSISVVARTFDVHTATIHRVIEG